jgi:molecular chaperone DnaK
VKDVLLLDVTPLSLGVETLGGVMTKLIEQEHHDPDQQEGGLLDGGDSQPSVRSMCCRASASSRSDNRTLGQFELSGIAPAPRGMPQIEVEFAIDANGILTVTATDTKDGQEGDIKITNSGGLDKARSSG